MAVDFPKGKCNERLHNCAIRAQKVLDSQVMKDANYFCPQDTGALQRSVLGSIIGSGVIIWAIEYAKKMYHFAGRVRRESNPNASVKWFEVAKARYLEKWRRLVQNEYNK